MSGDVAASVAAVLAAHAYELSYRSGAICACGFVPSVDPETLQTQQDYHRAHLAEALGPLIAAAEQRGREDNADHGQCYVHGSRALEARLAEAWDEGALFAAVECGAIEDEARPWLAPGDNPYREVTP